MANLGDLAAVVRSKNAGPFRVTFDIMFIDEETFERVLAGGDISQERFCETYGVESDEVEWTVYRPGLAFKATMPRRIASGDHRDGDVYGCQQHGPLLAWDVRI